MVLTLDRVPLPPAARGRQSEFPFRNMDNGESFFVPNRTKPLPITDWRDATGFRFATRQMVEDGVKGIRCWRVA